MVDDNVSSKMCTTTHTRSAPLHIHSAVKTRTRALCPSFIYHPVSAHYASDACQFRRSGCRHRPCPRCRSRPCREEIW